MNNDFSIQIRIIKFLTYDMKSYLKNQLFLNIKQTKLVIRNIQLKYIKL